MKLYFQKLTSPKTSTCISPSEISAYKQSLINELKKMGADESEIELIRDETIINSIKNDWTVKDVAWAILQ